MVIPDTERPLLERFYWIRESVLAGCSRPGGRRGDQLAPDLDALRGYGIGAIVSLTETPLDEFIVGELGITYAHIPIVDMTAPSPAQLFDALDAIDLAHGENRAVVVHCLAGQGRTGTVLAAWLIRQGAGADEAIAEVRAACPQAVENDAQLACLRVFERDRLWVV